MISAVLDIMYGSQSWNTIRDRELYAKAD